MIRAVTQATSRCRLSLLVETALLLPLLIVFPTAASAVAQETENQAWPEVDAFVKLSGKTRLFFRYSATRQEDLSSYSDGQVGGYLDFYALPLFRGKLHRHVDEARNKSLMIRAGYLLDRTPADSSGASVTQMPTIEAHGRVELPEKILLSDRNRLDFRIVNGDYRPRYRNRIKAERTFKAGRFELSPYAHFEVFYDWHLNTFNRFRLTGGGEWTLTRHISLEIYYTRQRDTAPSEKFVNAIGAVVQFYLR